MSYPLPFVRSLMSLTQHTFIGSTVAGASAAILLGLTGVQGRGLPKLACSVAGLSIAAVGYRQYLDNKHLSELQQDLGIVERKAGISWYSSVFSSPSSVQMLAEPTAHSSQPMQDIVSYWRQQDKHLLVVGGTGAGKSYFVQAFCSALQQASEGFTWHYKLYDTDCTIDDWSYLRSLPTCILYESFSQVERQMQADLKVIEQRTVERKKAGNTWQTEQTMIVAEELPALVDECESTKEWVRKQAKRGRRVKRFVCLVAQNDTVANLGLEGDSKLRDSCFVRVYLGQSAIDRAKQLKDTGLEQALATGGKSVCLVDDMLFTRPKLPEAIGSLARERSPEVEKDKNEGASEPSEPVNLGEPSLSPLTGLPALSPQLVAHLSLLHSQGKSIQQILLEDLGQKKGGNWSKKVEWLRNLLEG